MSNKLVIAQINQKKLLNFLFFEFITCYYNYRVAMRPERSAENMTRKIKIILGRDLQPS